MANIQSNEITELRNCLNLTQFLNNTTKSSNRLTFVHTNIRSMIKNYSKLLASIYNGPHRIDVIVLTEVNINDSISSLYEIDDYIMYSNLRTNRKGGGIIVYVHKKTRVHCNTKKH